VSATDSALFEKAVAQIRDSLVTLSYAADGWLEAQAREDGRIHRASCTG
jgi:hypothetical protein